MVQSEANGIFLRIPTPNDHCSSKSAMILATGGSSRSRSCSKGASILVLTTSLKPQKSTAFARSMTVGIEAKRMLSGLGSEPMQRSHSSVTTKVIRRLCFLEDNNLHKLILAWERHRHHVEDSGWFGAGRIHTRKLNGSDED